MIKLLENNYLVVKDKQTSHMGHHYLNQEQETKIPIIIIDNFLIISPFHTPTSNSLWYTVLSLEIWSIQYPILLMLFLTF